MIRRTVKFLLSFLKSSWSLDDYPVRYFQQDIHRMSEFGYRREGWEDSAWRAQVEAWPLMFGLGASREEAYRKLEANFLDFLDGGEPLPRPGTRVALNIQEPIRDRITDFDDVARHFMEHILKFKEGYWISDHSSIWDFPVDGTAEELARKIALRYGVDVTDLIGPGILVDIFERIASQGNFR